MEIFEALKLVCTVVVILTGLGEVITLGYVHIRQRLSTKEVAVQGKRKRNRREVEAKTENPPIHTACGSQLLEPHKVTINDTNTVLHCMCPTCVSEVLVTVESNQK